MYHQLIVVVVGGIYVILAILMGVAYRLVQEHRIMSELLLRFRTRAKA